MDPSSEAGLGNGGLNQGDSGLPFKCSGIDQVRPSLGAAGACCTTLTGSVMRFFNSSKFPKGWSGFTGPRRINHGGQHYKISANQSITTLQPGSCTVKSWTCQWSFPSPLLKALLSEQMPT
ncbi:hypothetical protein AAC387_Pa12g1710 [Persea americana]